MRKRDLDPNEPGGKVLPLPFCTPHIVEDAEAELRSMAATEKRLRRAAERRARRVIASANPLLEGRTFLRQFLQIPKDLIECGELSAPAIFLYGELFHRWNRRKTPDWLQATEDDLAKSIGTSVPTIKRALRALRQHKLILVLSEPGKPNRFGLLKHPLIQTRGEPQYFRRKR